MLGFTLDLRLASQRARHRQRREADPPRGSFRQPDRATRTWPRL